MDLAWRPAGRGVFFAERRREMRPEKTAGMKDDGKQR